MQGTTFAFESGMTDARASGAPPLLRAGTEETGADVGDDPPADRVRLRDQLIALEIRARCEEWRRGDIQQPTAARALRQVQDALRDGIWLLGIQAAMHERSRPQTPDPWLLAELEVTSRMLREIGNQDPGLVRVRTSIEEAARTLQAEEAARATNGNGPYRGKAATVVGARSRAAPCMPARESVPTPPPSDHRSVADVARAVSFVAIAWAGMATAAAGLRWLPVGMAVLLLAWLVTLPARR